MKYFAFALVAAVALCTSRSDAQTYTTLVAFTGTSGTANGEQPWGGLTLSGTTLYGMTKSGGTLGKGNVFSVGVNGSNYRNLLSFSYVGGLLQGYAPFGNLTLSGTTLYGATSGGGALPSEHGNVFSLGTNGTNFQNLVSFSGTGGSAIGEGGGGTLILSNTTLYGATGAGGVNGIGNVFSVGIDGTNYQNLLSFTGSGNGGTANGMYPGGALTLCNTTLYGVTGAGGVNGYGNVFSVGTDGTNYRNLISLTGSGGAASGDSPRGSLALSGTTLYVMTFGDPRLNYNGNVFSVGTDGTNYRNLVSFTGTSGTASGYEANGGLLLSGTTLYGMTAWGGTNGPGRIFSVGIDGSDYEDLYDFKYFPDGQFPEGDLILSSGTLFGMTMAGGANGNGTIFALTLPPAPTPEPGTLALVGAAAVALVSYRWRRMRPRREDWRQAAAIRC